MATHSPRPLSSPERELLEWLLTHGAPEGLAFVPHLEELRVVGTCDCGCPTIDIAPFGQDSRAVGASFLLADCEGVTPEGIRVGVILHARSRTDEGPLEVSELEVYPLAEVDSPFGVPVPSALTDSFVP